MIYFLNPTSIYEEYRVAFSITLRESVISFVALWLIKNMNGAATICRTGEGRIISKGTTLVLEV